MSAEPIIIEFPVMGNSDIGYLTVAESPLVPFAIKRVYWTYYTSEKIMRGHHAHYNLQQLIFAVSGRIEIDLEGLDGVVRSFVLDKPSIGLYVPKLFWRTIKFSDNSVLLCLASDEYREEDYIREYTDFKLLSVH
ncbi:sugar 3,4-ketoisomerase [Hymenobacter pini]|uniref:sugar 3,4-ketoisomerase n=1 Tax=Hymenobacter pini TaxID=2880879 RepID=UPI001CF54427|nr:FdtA/QdtA family cupin domain-containing protein [Hymenobacter pini]MCA8833422.1 FdtA/QdtA family cupin domain-containing protein [Hymenobacter pini]